MAENSILDPPRLTQLPTSPGIPVEYQGMWRRLLCLKIDQPDKPLSFCKKLAKEQNWSEHFAHRALTEYKRFLFLCRAVDDCTPSQIVDKAWHLHLQYSRQYWDVLCDEILGIKLHHDPGTGDIGEDTLYEGVYQRTLDAYAAIFGEPPQDIWGVRNNRPR